MPTQHRLNNLTKALRLRQAFKPMFSAVALAATLPLAIQAQAQEYQLNIPAQPLKQALQELASKTGVQLLYSPSDVEGLRSTTLNGRYQLADSIRIIIQSAGLTYDLNGNTVTLQPASSNSLKLSATEITSQRLGATTEGTGSYTTGVTSTATKMDLSIRETPQSVSVITRQKMDDENVQTLNDVADTATGITYNIFGSERPTYYSRGFTVGTMQIDGVPMDISDTYSFDILSLSNMAIYDRVEIVRGANGLLQGSGNPSAAINLVRKRPTSDFQLNATVGAGSWDNYQTQVDISGPLNQAKNIRGRAVILYNNSNSYRDYYEKDNRLLYLIGDIDLTPETTFTLGSIIQKDNTNGYDWGGLPTRTDGGFYSLPRSTNLNNGSAHVDKTNYTLFSEIRHSFQNDWKLTANLNRIWAEADYLSGFATRVAGDIIEMNYRRIPHEADQTNFDIYTSGPFIFLNREHQLVAGANTKRNKTNWKSHKELVYTAPVDMLNPGKPVDVPPIKPNPSSSSDGDNKERGVYSAVRLQLLDQLHLTLGGRLSWFDYKLDKTSYKESGNFTPYAGLVYDLTKNSSFYLSYTEIFKTQSNYGIGNTLLDPIIGSNYEAGIKSELLQEKLNISFAIFQTDQKNLPESLDSPKNCGISGAGTCYKEAEKVSNQGFEAEISGIISKNWNATFGYTYSDPKYIAGPKKNKSYSNNTPRNLLKLSTDYRLPGKLRKWNVGGSIQARSKTYQSGTSYGIAYKTEQPSYAILNLHAKYEATKNLQLQYNLKNALDKKYYQSTGSPDSGSYYGEPRNFMITVHYKFR